MQRVAYTAIDFVPNTASCITEKADALDRQSFDLLYFGVFYF